MTRRTSIITCLSAFIGTIFMFTTAHASLQSCVAGLKRAAIKAGVSRAVANQALSNVKYDEKPIRFSRFQPENRILIWDYMAFLVDAKRISVGREMLKKHTLKKLTGLIVILLLPCGELKAIMAVSAVISLFPMPWPISFAAKTAGPNCSGAR